MSCYVIVDFEMCNVPFRAQADEFKWRHEIIQIGAVLLDKALKVCDTFMTYVHPQYGKIDQVIENLTCITNDDVSAAPDCREALSEFVNWLPPNTILVSWSKSDETQIRNEVKEKSINIPKLDSLLNSWIDCQKTFSDIMGSERCYNLEEALNISSLDYDENVHNALTDAKNTALLFAKMENEKGDAFKLSPYISIGENENSGYTPFANLLKAFSEVK